MKLKQKGFTLIELLVVISIIALLASIILAALNTSIDRAHIAAGEQFADQVYHTAGDAIIGDWEFDDCSSGTTVKDYSGNGNVGSLVNGAVQNNPSTPNGTGCSLSLSSSNSQYVSTATGFLHNPSQFTFSVWIKTTNSSGGKIIGFQQNGSTYDNQMYMGNDGKIYFGVWNNLLSGGALVISSVPLNDGKWHNVVGTNDGVSTEYLYVDGVLQSKNSSAALSQSISGSWYIGGTTCTNWKNCGSGYFTGLIDGVRIYNKFLSP